MTALTQAEPRLGLIGPLPRAAEISAAGSPNVREGPGDEQWSRILEELFRIRNLGEDWDGQGARAVSAANVDGAIAWVNDMCRWHGAVPPEQAVPGVAGEVYLVWQLGAKYLEAEIGDPQQVEWMYSVPGQPTRQWKTDRSISWVVGPLAWDW